MPTSFIALFSLILTVMAQAQEQEVLIEAIQVESESMYPAGSLTVLTSAELKKKGFSSVADVLREVPGVQITRQGPIGQTTSAFLRGARSEGVLVLIDGIEVNDASSPACGFDFSALSVTNLDRVEIFRGPQSVRFGAGALGGVINILTKNGRSARKLEFELEGGSYGTQIAKLQTSGGSSVFGSSFALDGFQSRGFSAAAGGLESDSAQIYSASGKIHWSPQPDMGFTGNFRYTNAAAGIDRQGGSAGDDPNDTSKAHLLNAGVEAHSRFLEDRLLTSAYFALSKSNRHLKNDPDSLNATSSQDDFWGQNRKAQTDADLLFGDRHIFRLSLQWREEKATAESEFLNTKTSVPEKGQSIAGPSLAYMYEDENWFSDFGVRQDRSSAAGTIESYRASIGRNIPKGKISLTYGTGFKLPSLYQLYSSYGDIQLKAENARSLDLSVETSPVRGLFLSATYFESRSSDLIDFNMSTYRYFNVLKASSKGLETALKARWAHHYQTDFTYTYLEAKDESTGLGLLRRPRHSAGLQMSRDWGALEAAIGIRYRGARPDIDPSNFQRTENPAYEVWELKSTYRISNFLRLHGRIENLFNRKYEDVLGYGTPGLSLYFGLSGEI